MSPGERLSANAIAAAILDYLGASPHASDTAEGIARFWLPDPLRRAPPDLVRRALDGLVADGALVQIPVAGGEPRYAAAPRSADFHPRDP